MIKVWYILNRASGLSSDLMALAMAHGTDLVHMNKVGEYDGWLGEVSDRRKSIKWVPDATTLTKVADLLKSRGIEHIILKPTGAASTVGLMIYPTDERNIPDVLK